MSEFKIIKSKSIFFYVSMILLFLILILWMLGIHIIDKFLFNNLSFNSKYNIKFSVTNSSRLFNFKKFFALKMKNPNFIFTKADGSIMANNLLVYSDILAKNLIFDLKGIKVFNKNNIEYVNILDNLRIKISFSKSLFLLKMQKVSFNIIDYITIANINNNYEEVNNIFNVKAAKVDFVKDKISGWDISIIVNTLDTNFTINFLISISAIDSFYLDIRNLYYNTNNVDVDMGGVIAFYPGNVNVKIIIDSMNMLNFINDAIDKLLISKPWHHNPSILSLIFQDDRFFTVCKKNIIDQIILHQGKQRLVIKSNDNGQIFIGSKNFNSILTEINN